MPVLVVALVCITVYRITRLVTIDEFPPVKLVRDTVISRFGEDSSWAYLVECPWCASVYVGAAVVAATAWVAGLPVPWLVWPATSAVTGWLAMKED